MFGRQIDVPDNLDRSIEADAKRFRWLLDGNAYFPEEEGMCGNSTTTEIDHDELRAAIDEQMAYKEQRASGAKEH